MSTTITGLFDSMGNLPASVAMPSVSVIVTNYNYEQYVVKCLESIFNQTYDNFHCVVVDDCSTDESVKKIREFAGRLEDSKKFELLVHDKNLGQLAAFWTGLKRASGEFVVFVDSDDVLSRDFLEKHVRIHLESFPVAFTSSDQCQINHDDQITCGTHLDHKGRGKRFRVNKGTLFKPFWIWGTTSSMMFRRAVLEEIVIDDVDDFRKCADNYVCHFANVIGGSLLIPDVLGCYRRHGKNLYGTNPIIGGHSHSGDYSGHPAHVVVRKAIFNRVIDNFDRFRILQGKSGAVKLLCRVATLGEAVDLLLGKESNILGGKDAWKLKPLMALYSLAFHALATLKTYSTLTPGPLMKKVSPGPQSR